MSWRATAYVKKLGPDKVTRAEKLLMFVLADQYLDDRKQAHPQSVAELATDALMSERQARRCLRSLEGKRLLYTLRRPGREHTNFYRFLELENVDTTTPFDSGKPDNTGRKRGHHGSGKGTPQVGKADTAMSAPAPRYKEEQTIDKTDRTERNGSPGCLFALWNAHCGSLPHALALTPDRIAKCRARLKSSEFSERFERAVHQAARTPFLLGQNDRSWQATFDWMIKNDSNVLKVLEGKYGKAVEGEGAAQNNGDASAAREREWKGWLIWASAKSLEELRTVLSHDWDSYPAWARLRAQKYIQEREAAKS